MPVNATCILSLLPSANLSFASAQCNASYNDAHAEILSALSKNADNVDQKHDALLRVFDGYTTVNYTQDICTSKEFKAFIKSGLEAIQASNTSLQLARSFGFCTVDELHANACNAVTRDLDAASERASKDSLHCKISIVRSDYNQAAVALDNALIKEEGCIRAKSCAVTGKTHVSLTLIGEYNTAKSAADVVCKDPETQVMASQFCNIYKDLDLAITSEMTALNELVGQVN